MMTSDCEDILEPVCLQHAKTLNKQISEESTSSFKRQFSHTFDRKESLLSSRINIFVKNSTPNIPDGGWGWLVVLASLLINLISDGVCFTYGLLHVEFLKEFGASHSATSWIGSLFLSVPLLVGPVMSALVNKYGCRMMTIIGGLISGFGFILSSYANSIAIMYVTFGVVGGVGLGLCYVTAVVAIAFWFDKKRTLALGLGACGTGIGTFLYAPFSTYLINEYGWRGTNLILAGTFLNMCVCGAVMRDPDWIIQQNKKSQSCKSSKNSNYSTASDGNKMKTYSKNEEYYDMLHSPSSSPSKSQRSNIEQCNSDVNLPTFVKRHEKDPSEVIHHLKANEKLNNVLAYNYSNLSIFPHKETNHKYFLGNKNVNTANVKQYITNKPLKHQVSEPVDLQANLERSVKLEVRSNSLIWFKRPFESHNYLRNLKCRGQYTGYQSNNMSAVKLRTSSCPNINKSSFASIIITTDNEKWYADILELLNGMLNFSLFLELHFLLMSLSTVLLFTWFIVPYFYLAEHMTRFGYSEEQISFLMSIIGVTNTIGMIFLGWAGDQPWMNVAKTYAICLILSGIFCAALYFFTSIYYLMVTFGALFGLFLASCFSFTPALLAELVPLEKFTVAYGLILLCQGIGNLLGPPLTGWLFDETKSWDQSFYQAGFWIFVSGVLVGIIPYTSNIKLVGPTNRLYEENIDLNV